MSEHYRSHPSGIEAIEITQYESFLRGNIIKYVLRAPYKGDELADLEKAAEYLQWEIERVKEEEFWEHYEDTTVKERLQQLNEMRNEWDSDENIGYVTDNWDEPYGSTAGMTYTYNNVFKPGKSNYKFRPFDEVVFPDKCQECDGDCKVC